MGRRKEMLKNLAIVVGPILLIMLLLQSQVTSLTELGTWDMAISIGAMITVLIYLLIDKGRKR